MAADKLENQINTDVRKRKKRINRTLIVLGITVFRVFLDIAYPNIICRAYFYYGFYSDLNVVKLILSYAAMFAVLAAFIPQIRLEHPGSLLLLMVLVMAFVPNMALFAGMNLPYRFFLMSVIFWAATAFFYRLGFANRVRFRFGLGSPRAPRRTTGVSDFRKYWILYLAFLLVFAYSVYFNHGLSFRVGLRDANELRLAARGNVGGAAVRILSWSGSIFFPMGIILSVKNRKPVLFALMMLGEVAAYSVNGTKTWLFTAALAFLMAVFVQKESRIALLPWVFAGMAAVGLLLGLTNKLGLFFNNYFIRRVFFATSLNNHYWIDFFTSHPKMYFTGGILGWVRRFIEVPYATNVSSIIGEIYYNMPESNASSGTIAYAYANLGWFGLVFYSFLTVVFAELMDIVAVRPGKKVPIPCFYPLIICASEYLVNGAIMTAAITYGYIPGLLLIAYLRHLGAFAEDDEANVRINRKQIDFRFG